MTSGFKLSTLALAAGAVASIAGPAAAQSSITLYGILDASVEYVNADVNATTSSTGAVNLGEDGLRLTNGVQQGSRLGIRGTEDLGGGQRAIFTIEHRFAIDTGDTSGGSGSSGNQKFWSGQAWVGLQGGWGRLTAGRQYTPLYNMLQPTDATSYHWYNNVSTFFNNRLDNSLEYRTPTFGGLVVNAMYAFGENLGPSTTAGVTNEAGDAYGVGAQWGLGGFLLSGAYMSYGATASNVSDRSEWGAGGKFSLSSQTMLGAGYLWSDRSGRDTSSIYVSGSIGLGSSSLYANYVMVDVDGRKSSNRIGVAWSLPLSKRTNVYVATGLSSDVPLGSGANLTYTDPVLAAVGVRHLF
jgi:predicted porin